MERIDIFQLKAHFPKYEIVVVKEGEKQVDLKEQTNELQKELDIHVQSLHKDMVQTTAGESENEQVLTCTTAPGVTFKTVGELTAHYKTDWHLWNLKLKASNLQPLPKNEFEQLVKDGDLSGMSIVEDVEEDPETEFKPLKGSNRVKFITNDSQQIELWKNVVIANPKERTVLSDLIGELEGLHEKKRWLILMSSGGRFAGAAFEENTCTKHKTFVRYTVRKKQGGSQSTKDNKSGSSAPKSAGATMRRYNEKRFREQILEVLSAWEEEVKSAHLIFLCAPGANWNYFFVGLKGLKRSDPRIRSVPFTAHRPSLVEVKRIQYILSSVEISKYEEDETNTSSAQPTELLTTINLEDHPTQEEAVHSEHSHEAQEDKIAKAIKDNDLEGLMNIFQSDYEIPIPHDANSIKTPVYLCVELNNTHILQYLIELDTGDLDTPTIGWHDRTPLHRAAIDGNTEVVKMLLDANANPSLKDANGQTPYLLANTALREYLRKYAAEHLEMWEWEKLGITPLTKQMEEAKKLKMAEKKKRKKAQAKLNKNEKKALEQQEAIKNKLEQEKKERERHLNEIAIERASKLANMTEREKRALAAEARFSLKQGLCAYCNIPLTLVPFERLEYKYCTVECVGKHMEILDKIKIKK